MDSPVDSALKQLKKGLLGVEGPEDTETDVRQLRDPEVLDYLFYSYKITNTDAQGAARGFSMPDPSVCCSNAST